jgi:hypothetical protein
MVNSHLSISQHTPETKLIYIGQSAGENRTMSRATTSSFHMFSSSIVLFCVEHSYIAIAIIKGKMLSIAIHTPSSVSTSTTHMLDTGDVTSTEKLIDESHSSSGLLSLLINDKDVPLASLSTARCGFGITSINGVIFAVGTFLLLISI